MWRRATRFRSHHVVPRTPGTMRLPAAALGSPCWARNSLTSASNWGSTGSVFRRRGGGLFRQDGPGSFAPVGIGSRALDVLAVLIAHHGQVVSKVAIIDAVGPDVVVEERNLAVQISALRRVLDHRRTDGSCIQTEAGRGYRFVAAVTRIADELLPSPSVSTPTPPDTQPANDSTPTPRRERPRRHAIAAIAAAAFAAVVLAALAWDSVGISPSETPRPRLSIAVLPFANLSVDRGDDYLADAITDDLTTDLSRVSGMFVIARQSSYTYQGKTVDIRKVGEELGVRYALEGSVRRLGDELRVNAQLISTETGAHLWAERFDRPLLDLSAAILADGEDDIIRHIASALNVKMVDVESARSLRERPGNAEATDLVLRARSLSNQPPSRERTAEAGELYEQALKRDPSSVSAMVGIAGILINQSQGYLGQWAAADALERAGKLMSEPRAIEASSEQVLVGSVRLLEAQHRWEGMIPAAERLIAAFPNRVDEYELLATAKRYTGKPADAVPHL
jgi:TolB-like protein/DNA-binding winged helix-turn-helix (wHTH) protein